jgi:hypothetical protein
MRGCLLSLVLVVLIAANGYCIWRIHELRALVAEIHADMLEERERERKSMIDHARSALDAIGRGERERAREELKRLSELIEETRTMAQQQRERLQERLADAKEAIDRGSARATELVERLVRDLSQRDEQENDGETSKQTEEP